MMRSQSLVNRYSVRDTLESITLVDAENKEIGSCGKIDAHLTGQMHRAFSILITNPAGELLLQQRAGCKYHFAGLWSNTCCGHPRPGEQTPAAARRRLQEELGFSVPLDGVDEFQYRAEDPVSGLIEHEHLSVFQGHYGGDPCPNPDEVSAYCWMLPNRILKNLALHPDIFTPWFALLADRLVRNQQFGKGLDMQLDDHEIDKTERMILMREKDNLKNMKERLC